MRCKNEKEKRCKQRLTIPLNPPLPSSIEGVGDFGGPWGLQGIMILDAVAESTYATSAAKTNTCINCFEAAANASSSYAASPAAAAAAAAATLEKIDYIMIFP
jgi:hypothetical protein